MKSEAEQMITITKTDKEAARNPDGCISNPTHLAMRVYYSLGGINYFNYKQQPRGYYLSVSPVQYAPHDRGCTLVSSMMGSGTKVLLLEVARQSEKQFQIACGLAEQKAPELLDWCKAEYGIEWTEPEGFFADVVKRPLKSLPIHKAVEAPAQKPKPIRSMKLLTASIIRQLERHPFGSQDGKGDDAKVLVKFFGGSSYTLLVTEGEKQEDGDWLFYGKGSLGDEWEWGYAALSEIETKMFPPFNLGVERDMYLPERATVGQLIKC